MDAPDMNKIVLKPFKLEDVIKDGYEEMRNKRQRKESRKDSLNSSQADFQLSQIHVN
jgi:hypothetical protein